MPPYADKSLNPLESTLDDHTTHPALLAQETIPVPLTGRAPLAAASEAPPPAPAPAWPSLLLKLAGAVLLVWLLRRWWLALH